MASVYIITIHDYRGGVHKYIAFGNYDDITYNLLNTTEVKLWQFSDRLISGNSINIAANKLIMKYKKIGTIRDTKSELIQLVDTKKLTKKQLQEWFQEKTIMYNIQEYRPSDKVYQIC